VFVARDDAGVHGAIGGNVVPFWWNDTVRAASEQFWYVQPEYRGGTAGIKLLDAFERQAVNDGASWIAMQAGITKSAASLLERKGYMVQGPVCMKKVR
jgi:GNAT superfamily N-acetyltransferase